MRGHVKTEAQKPQVLWKTLAIANEDPHAFAQALEAGLQELTDNGYNLVSQIPRGTALILTGQRVLSQLATPLILPSESGPAPEPRRRRLVDTPPSGQRSEEVLYHYREGGAQKQLWFGRFAEALRTLRTHLERTDDVVEPLSITLSSMTRYEASSWVALLRAFAHELDSPPPNKPLE